MAQKILMVDDDEQVAAVLHSALETLGHHVTVCTDAMKADAVSQRLQPNLVLLDMMMPGKSGLDLVVSISKLCPNAVVCLVTGMNDPEVLQKSVKVGAWSVLYKPYSLSELADLIVLSEQLSTAIRIENTISKYTKVLDYSWPGDKPIDPDSINELVQFARKCGADSDVASRRLPLMAIKLLSNAVTHGTCGLQDRTYGMRVTDEGDEISISVYHDGGNFNWRRELSRLSCSSVSKVTGLQLVQELADKFSYTDDGRRSNASVGKTKLSESSHKI